MSLEYNAKHQLSLINPNLKICSKFHLGMSNETYLVIDKNSKQLYVYRFCNQFAHLFVNFSNEKLVLQKIAYFNFVPKLYYFDESSGEKLSQYIYGNILTDFSDLTKVVNILKQLHNSHLAIKSYDHLQRLIDYEHLLLASQIDDMYYVYKNQWLQIYNNLLSNYVTYPTHGDAQPNNFILSNNCLYLIDWEFAGLNDYIYDIVCFGNNDFALSYRLLCQYESNPTNNHIQRLLGWKIYQSLQWYLVASYKAFNYPQSDIDFFKIRDKYFCDIKKYLMLFKKYHL